MIRRLGIQRHLWPDPGPTWTDLYSLFAQLFGVGKVTTPVLIMSLTTSSDEKSGEKKNADVNVLFVRNVISIKEKRKNGFRLCIRPGLNNGSRFRLCWLRWCNVYIAISIQLISFLLRRHERKRKTFILFLITRESNI